MMGPCTIVMPHRSGENIPSPLAEGDAHAIKLSHITELGVRNDLGQATLAGLNVISMSSVF
jgi:hypothetical protein